MAASPRTDEELLADFTSGRRGALGELARRHEAEFLGLAAGLLDGRNDLAMDAVQESWLRIVRFAGRFNGRSSFKTWAYRIVVNQCRDLARMNASQGHGGEVNGHTSEPPGIARGDEGGRHSLPDRPDIAAEHGERDRLLRQAVDALLPDKREILLLCYHKGLTHTEAADVLEIPIGTLKSRLNAALTELRERLGSKVRDA